MLEQNRLALIRSWSMDGATGDLDRSFESAVDIHALTAVRDEEPTTTPERSVRPAFMMKPAGEGEWRPLIAEPGIA